MSGNEIAALIVAVGGFLGAVLAGFRNLRSDKTKHEIEASAALLTGYTGMVSTLQAQMTAMEERHVRERREWAEEKADLRREHAEEIAELNERIDELGTQVYVLQNRPEGSRSRETDQ